MNVVVTGAAGFIGSRLSRGLLDAGCRVTGIDCLTDFYSARLKKRNLAPLLGRHEFRWLAEDLNDLSLGRILRGAEAVVHLAAQAGVRDSWGRRFEVYIRHNIRATQKLLEAAKGLPLRVFLNASSSSVYGQSPVLPLKESSPLQPLSPYGVTKLAAENLCTLYFHNYGLPAVSLRFFTVYGPGQRPDMAFHKFLKAIGEGREITVYGDGTQTRDFTYVDDIVSACLAALERGRPGQVYNIGGGHRERLDRIFVVLEKVTRRTVRIATADVQKGDVRDTFADITKARQDLGFNPKTELEAGLSRQWEDIQELYAPRKRTGTIKGSTS